MTREETQDFNRRHYRKYAGSYKQRSRIRLETIKVAKPAWVNEDELKQIYKDVPDGYHVDHIIPLKGITPEGWEVSGLHVPWNLQYLSARENLVKGNRVQRHDLNEVV